MEAIILSKDQFLELITKVDQIDLRVQNLANGPPKTFIDNSEFIRLMKISKRTAQTWRDENVIAFSQIGSKLYYRYSDIEKLLLQRIIHALPIPQP
jgi:hypothetical protein